MLEELIRAIETGSTVQTAELARRLQTSLVMVQMMLEDLERMGKLARVQSECAADHCGDCPVANMCVTQQEGKGRIWQLL